MATFLNIYSAPKREQQIQPKGRLKRPKRAGSLPQEPTPFRAAYPFKSTRPPSSTTGVVEARNSTEFSSSSPHKNEHGRILSNEMGTKDLDYYRYLSRITLQ